MKTKVLILQGIISEYRVPIYNLISNKVDLTLGYMEENRATSVQNYEVVKIKYAKIKSIYINGISLLKLCNNYDVVIFFGSETQRILLWNRNVMLTYIFFAVYLK